MVGIMIVEDDRDTLEILNAVLQRKFSDASFFTARNGREGVELFKKQQIDLVITDVNMPQMGGAEMVREMRALKPDTHFIFITADAGKATLEHAIGKGFRLVHYLPKPVAYHDLFHAVEQALGGRQEQ